MSCARPLAGFVAGAVVSTALWSRAAPEPARYRSYETFAQALAIIQTHAATPVEESRLVEDAIAGMAHGLDPYTRYLRPRRFQTVQEDTEGELADVGLVLGAATAPSSPGLTVVAVLPASAGEAAGLAPGDRVLAIDGVSTAAPSATSSVKAWQDRLRGSAGTRLTLEVERLGWRRPRQLTLVRAHRRVTTVRHQMLRDVAHVSIDRFVETTAAEVRAALAAVERAGAAAVVLDLRANPGGLVEQALSVADLLLEDGTLVTIHERARHERRVAHPGGYQGPLVVLVDEGTASAAELLAAALADNRRAQLVGQPTYGKGTVQTFFPLLDGGGLKLTTGWYVTPAGNLLESNGIQPHVKVPRNIPDRNVPRTSSSQTPSAGNPNDATIAPGFDDDPQLVAAVALAHSSLRGAPNRGRQGATSGATARFPDRLGGHDLRNRP